MAKKTLKKLYTENFGSSFDDELDDNAKLEFKKALREFQAGGRWLYAQEYNLKETTERLKRMTEVASRLALEMNEGDDDGWFDGITVQRNMKELKSRVQEFEKSARELHVLRERCAALYDDVGVILGRYFDMEDPANAGKNPGVVPPTV